MFRLSGETIDAGKLTESLGNPSAGALVTFEGWVRNRNEGADVTALEYEGFDTLACKEAERIIEEAKARFALLDAACVHRVGRLKIGELAVWVGVVSVHRQAAFDACRYIIDEVKTRLPVWKKEYYVDGTSGWVNCRTCAGEVSHGGRLHGYAACRPVNEGDNCARQKASPEAGAEGKKV